MVDHENHVYTGCHIMASIDCNMVYVVIFNVPVLI